MEFQHLLLTLPKSTLLSVVVLIVERQVVTFTINQQHLKKLLLENSIMLRKQNDFQ